MARIEVVRALTKMVDDFVRCISGLGAVSSRDQLTFEKGQYEVLFLKPSRRLSNALSIERELLVLFTSFTDVQARTIGALKNVIQSADGRLEANVSIVVHCDNRGDGKLKNWGREAGISVLPVTYKGNLPQGEDFERLLCHEMFSHDPFDVTGPVSGDAQFYGRRTEALDLARRLQTGQICSTLGIRKIGKTSIINRVVADLRQNHDCLSVMIDCSRDQIWKQSGPQLLASICHSLEKAIEGSMGYCIVEENKGGLISDVENRLVKIIQSCDKPIVLIFDEVDYITPGSPTSRNWKADFNQFWRSVRSIYQETKRIESRLSVFIGGVSSKWFSIEEIDGIENAALAFVPEDYLSPLPRGASVAMIKKIGRVAGLQFDDRSAERVSEFCGDMPFWVRKACSFLHREVDVDSRPLQIQESKVIKTLDDFVHAEGATLAHVALRHLFRVYPELEPTMKQTQSGDLEKANRRNVSVLQRYGLLTFDAAPHIAGEMMKHGFDLYLDEQQVAASVVIGEIAEIGTRSEIDEWAEELAVIGKRRNVLEKRLRSIFLNFIRADHLKSMPAGSVAERILNMLQGDRRKKFQGKIAEEIVDGLYWKELVELVCDKEWGLFGQLLGDKTRFRQNCELINDRPDAHAKTIDAADIALYRRSLKTVEDLLTKIM
jgi:hypothetical protein